MASLGESTTRTARIEIEEFRRPIFFRGVLELRIIERGQVPRKPFRRRAVHTFFSAKRGREFAQKRGRDSAMHEHGFDRVADAGALRLGVRPRSPWPYRDRRLVDVDDADAVGVFDHRHARMADDRFDQGFAAARDDQIDVAIHLRHEPHRFAIGLRNEENAISGQARLGAAPLQRFGDRDVGIDRFGAAAQDGRVPGLRAKDSGVARDVRARLVDDPDHADRDAHFGDLEPVRRRPFANHFADRIGQGSDLANAAGAIASRRGPVQLQPIDHRAGESAAPRLRKILFVRGQNNVRTSHDLVRHGEKGRVFLRGVRVGRANARPGGRAARNPRISSCKDIMFEPSQRVA